MIQPDNNLQSKTKEYYDSAIVPEWLSFVYNDLSSSTHFPFGAARELVVRKAVADRHLSGLRAYDLGCGGGQLSVVLANLGFGVSALDFSEAMLSEAAALVAQHNLREKVQFQLSDFALDPARKQADGSFAIAMGFIEYLDDIGVFFDRAAHLLLPDGHLLVEFRNRSFNAVTGNKFTLEDAASGQFESTICSFQEFCAKCEVTQAHYDEFAVAVAAAYAATRRASPPRTKSLSQYFPIARRQHLESEVRSSAQAHEFDLVDLYGLHPHPFVPGLELQQPWLFNQMGWQLQQFPKNPLVISTCSSMAALFVRRHS